MSAVFLSRALDIYELGLIRCEAFQLLALESEELRPEFQLIYYFNLMAVVSTNQCFC